MRKSSELRGGLLALAIVRIIIGIAAIPLAPFLYKEHFLWLVLMRPTKEVLLAAGFLIRLDKVWWVPVLAAAVPLAIFGVWQFYYLGRQYAEEIKAGKVGSGWTRWVADRVLRPKRVQAMQRLLKSKGMKLVFLGRLAVFPSSLVALAAGSGNIKSRAFLPADAIGGLLSIVEVMGAGFVLGEAYEEAGPWITVVGGAVLVVVAVIIARGLRRDANAQRSRARSSRRKTGGRKPRADRATSRS
jgi:membrane-associated protein